MGRKKKGQQPKREQQSDQARHDGDQSYSRGEQSQIQPRRQIPQQRQEGIGEEGKLCEVISSLSLQEEAQRPPEQSRQHRQNQPRQVSAWQRPMQREQEISQQPQVSTQQWRSPKGRGQLRQSTSVGSEFVPQQISKSWQRVESGSRGRGVRPTTLGEVSSISFGRGRGQLPREPGRFVKEATSDIQREKDTQLSTPKVDSPSQLVPKTSTIARKGGTEAKYKITVETNFYPLNLERIKSAIHYDVTIVPDKPKKFLRLVMEELRIKRYRNRWPAFDGNKNLYSSSPLFESDEISDTVKIIMDDGKEKEFQVTVKFATEVNLTCLRNYMQSVQHGKCETLTKPMQALQCIDIVLRSAPAFSFIRLGRSYFTRSDPPYSLEEGAVLYHGFFQAAILGWKPFVNVDVANKAFLAAINLIDLLKEMFQDVNLDSELERYQIDRLKEHMIQQVKIEYKLPGNPASRRNFTVNGVDNPPIKARFTDDNGTTMTVKDYFKIKKNISIKYPNLPTLWVGSKNRKILLPLEFCTILPDQVHKNMSGNQTKKMIRYAATNTRTRWRNISHSLKAANYNESSTMKEFGITVNPTPQIVEARVLEPPMLEYKRKTESVSKGTWRASQFVHGASLKSWTVLCLDRYTSDDYIRQLEKNLIDTAETLGMDVSPPAPFTRPGDRKHEWENYFRFAAKERYQMIIVILNNNKLCYNSVKETSELAIGCLTQCLKSSTVKKLNSSTVTNILLKVNAKLNGVSHHLQGLGTILSKPCMIMGADVTHPRPGNVNFPSVAAVTASFDVFFTKYAFEWRLQPARREMIDDLQEITEKHLLNYYRKNNAKPEILMYIRDGVSDGEFDKVLNIEFRAIRSACSKFDGGNYKPGIVFVVVQKRHHTRFYPKDGNWSEDRNGNVPAGTCIDREITHPSIVDFYLVSHASIQGVAKPTKYVKLWDDCDMTEDNFEKLMYYLCHVFVRCNRSVSYPAPTYYAHLAAARARVYCEAGVDMDDLKKEQKRLTISESITQNLPMFFV